MYICICEYMYNIFTVATSYKVIWKCQTKMKKNYRNFSFFLSLYSSLLRFVWQKIEVRVAVSETTRLFFPSPAVLEYLMSIWRKTSKRGIKARIFQSDCVKIREKTGEKQQSIKRYVLATNKNSNSCFVVFWNKYILVFSTSSYAPPIISKKKI